MLDILHLAFCATYFVTTNRKENNNKNTLKEVSVPNRPPHKSLNFISAIPWLHSDCEPFLSTTGQETDFKEH